MCMRNSSTLRCLAQCLASVTTEKENNATLFILQKLVLIHDNMVLTCAIITNLATDIMGSVCLLVSCQSVLGVRKGCNMHKQN